MKLSVLTLILTVLSAAAAAQDSAAKYLSGPEFNISAEDEAAGIDGTIRVAIVVDKTGNVDRAVAYVGPAWPCGVDLDRQVMVVLRDAEAAVKKFKFSPAMKNGKPSEDELSVSLTVGKSARTAKLPADPNAAAPKKIDGGVVNGKALNLPKPAYPLAARSERASGSVNVQVLIGEDGTVQRAQAISGHPLLQWASRTAACGAKFAPTKLSGLPVKVSGVITYNFVP